MFETCDLAETVDNRLLKHFLLKEILTFSVQIVFISMILLVNLFLKIYLF